MARQRPLELLLVEDDPGDVVMTREALAEASSPSTLHVVADGVEALAFLSRDPAGSFRSAPAPDVVLLDLNLPRMDGHELLAELKASPEWKTIPVIVFTTSNADSDIRRSYELQASAFVTKPSSFEEFSSAVREIDRFFASVAELPER